MLSCISVLEIDVALTRLFFCNTDALGVVFSSQVEFVCELIKNWLRRPIRTISLSVLSFSYVVSCKTTVKFKELLIHRWPLLVIHQSVD